MEAEDGVQAVNRARQFKPDLIILDLAMPEMNEYPENLRNGDWEFAAFTADGKFNAQAPATKMTTSRKR